MCQAHHHAHGAQQGLFKRQQGPLDALLALQTHLSKVETVCVILGILVMGPQWPLEQPTHALLVIAERKSILSSKKREKIAHGIAKRKRKKRNSRQKIFPVFDLACVVVSLVCELVAAFILCTWRTSMYQGEEENQSMRNETKEVLKIFGCFGWIVFYVIMSIVPFGERVDFSEGPGIVFITCGFVAIVCCHGQTYCWPFVRTSSGHQFSCYFCCCIVHPPFKCIIGPVGYCFLADFVFTVAKLFPGPRYNCDSWSCRKVTHSCTMTLCAIPFQLFEVWLLRRMIKEQGTKVPALLKILENSANLAFVIYDASTQNPPGGGTKVLVVVTSLAEVLLIAFEVHAVWKHRRLESPESQQVTSSLPPFPPPSLASSFSFSPSLPSLLPP